MKIQVEQANQRLTELYENTSQAVAAIGTACLDSAPMLITTVLTILVSFSPYQIPASLALRCTALGSASFLSSQVWQEAGNPLKALLSIKVSSIALGVLGCCLSSPAFLTSSLSLDLMYQIGQLIAMCPEETGPEQNKFIASTLGVMSIETIVLLTVTLHCPPLLIISSFGSLFLHFGLAAYEGVLLDSQEEMTSREKTAHFINAFCHGIMAAGSFVGSIAMIPVKDYDYTYHYTVHNTGSKPITVYDYWSNHEPAFGSVAPGSSMEFTSIHDGITTVNHDSSFFLRPDSSTHTTTVLNPGIQASELPALALNPFDKNLMDFVSSYFILEHKENS